MEQDEKQTGRKRRQHLRVPVFPEEKEEIERQARQAGLSVVFRRRLHQFTGLAAVCA